ncbi:4881_t:CDS:2 [Ambispora leptoticha]|uniref:4881_t:CDS:1 n=1 Tax=Ambispora leptoticha TaxID=144679 RepID=A0A9N9BBH1_9GLOM|nr:4881_t:CDS:2 [Ambispora leptoticha]
MKICIIERFEVSANDIPEDVFRAHIDELWSLYLSGFIREAYKFSDDRGALYIVEANNLNEAKAVHLPLAIDALCTYQFITLGPYRTWEKLFQTNNEEIWKKLNTPAERLTYGCELKYFWMIATFNSNFTQEKYQNSVVEQAIETFRAYKAGIYDEFYVMQRPLIVTIRVLAKDIQEATIYIQKMPFAIQADQFRLKSIYRDSSKLIINDFLSYVKTTRFSTLSQETRERLHSQYTNYLASLKEIYEIMYDRLSATKKTEFNDLFIPPFPRPSKAVTLIASNYDLIARRITVPNLQQVVINFMRNFEPLGTERVDVTVKGGEDNEAGCDITFIVEVTVNVTCVIIDGRFDAIEANSLVIFDIEENSFEHTDSDEFTQCLYLTEYLMTLSNQ